MHQAPNNERPARAVPEAADQKGRHQVEIGAERSFAVPSERDIDIILQEPA
ncbi:hypothetical protein D3C76_1670680 [compost metagenome]